TYGVRFFTALLPLLLVSCGYRFSATEDALPKTIRTVSVPAFTNLTTRYKLTDQLPEAISREFITRTRYRVVSDSTAADAVLRGTVINYSFYPTIFDPATFRAAFAELHVTLSVTLTERATGKVIFSRPNFDVRETYQISPDATQYFEESDPALKRAGQQVARSIVSAVLQNF
ncbi:MAG TPA: LptE family protein, partial [Bryobacteraceae bacterium]|nr:LptE family protein [Bryobacteraceae bacterium]